VGGYHFAFEQQTGLARRLIATLSFKLCESRVVLVLLIRRTRALMIFDNQRTFSFELLSVIR
jgi:hypothetical protein